MPSSRSVRSGAIALNGLPRLWLPASDDDARRAVAVAVAPAMFRDPAQRP